MTFLGALLFILALVLCSLAVVLFFVAADLASSGDTPAALTSIVMLFVFGSVGVWIFTNASGWGMW